MKDLIEFIKARLDDDERDAREAITWEDERFTGHVYTWMLTAYLHGKLKRQHIIPGAPDPRRVLAEVDAKRLILDLLAETLDGASEYFTVESCDEVDAILAERTLRLLALSYAGHPDYRQEWQP